MSLLVLSNIKASAQAVSPFTNRAPQTVHKSFVKFEGIGEKSSHCFENDEASLKAIRKHSYAKIIEKESKFRIYRSKKQPDLQGRNQTNPEKKNTILILKQPSACGTDFPIPRGTIGEEKQARIVEFETCLSYKKDQRNEGLSTASSNKQFNSSLGPTTPDQYKKYGGVKSPIATSRFEAVQSLLSQSVDVKQVATLDSAARVVARVEKLTFVIKPRLQATNHQVAQSLPRIFKNAAKMK
jgi:hypothetical protein